MVNVTVSSEGLPLQFTTRKIIILLSMTFVSIATVLGNLLVLISYLKSQELRKSTNYFIISLAVADFFIGLLLVNFYSVYLLYGYWPFRASVCNMYLSLDYWLSQASVLNLVATSVERFVAIKLPLRYRVAKKHRITLFSIVGLWAASFLIWVPPILLFQYKDGQPTSSEDTSFIKVFHKKWYVSLITVCIAYYAPVLVVTILYIKICFLIIKQRQKFRTTKYANTSSKNLDCCCVNYDYSHDSILPNKKTVHLQSSLDKSCNVCIIPQTQFNRPEVCDIMPQEIECSPTSQTPELKCQKFKLQEIREQ